MKPRNGAARQGGAEPASDQRPAATNEADVRGHTVVKTRM